jgi:hypothetical protein
MTEELIGKWLELKKLMAPDIDPQRSALLIIILYKFSYLSPFRFQSSPIIINFKLYQQQ